MVYPLKPINWEALIITRRLFPSAENFRVQVSDGRYWSPTSANQIRFGRSP